MKLYDAWNSSHSGGSNQNDEPEHSSDGENPRAAIARGQALFNTKNIQIRNVKGLNDDLNAVSFRVHAITCLTRPIPTTRFQCNHLEFPMNRGDAGYELPQKQLTTVIKTRSGRALITGKWQDIDALRTGPAQRRITAPYFRDGSANLHAVVDFTTFALAWGLQKPRG
jgi:hypothetical protein